MKIYALLYILIMVTVLYTLSGMEQPEQVKKLAETPQIGTLVAEAIKKGAYRVHSLIEQNNFESAKKELKKLPFDMQIPLFKYLVFEYPDSQNLKDFIASYIAEIEFEAAKQELTDLQRSQILLTEIPSLIMQQYIVDKIIEAIESEEPIEALLAQLPIELQKNISEAQKKEDINSIKSKCSRCEAIENLQKVPWDLQLAILEQVLQKSNKIKIWEDEEHTIPHVYYAAFVETEEERVIFGFSHSLYQFFDELLFHKNLTEEQQQQLAKLMFNYQETFGDYPLLVQHAEDALDEEDEVNQKTKVDEFKTSLQYASEQNKFDTAYFIIFHIVVLGSSQMQDKLQFLLENGISPTVTNKQGQSLIDVLKQWKEPETERPTIGGRQLYIDPTKIDEMLEYLQKYLKTTELE